jgi:hypothetical protein
VICGVLTGYIKRSRSETIPTEADMYMPVRLGELARKYQGCLLTRQ